MTPIQQQSSGIIQTCLHIQKNPQTSHHLLKRSDLLFYWVSTRPAYLTAFLLHLYLHGNLNTKEWENKGVFAIQILTRHRKLSLCPQDSFSLLWSGNYQSDACNCLHSCPVELLMGSAKGQKVKVHCEELLLIWTGTPEVHHLLFGVAEVHHGGTVWSSWTCMLLQHH